MLPTPSAPGPTGTGVRVTVVWAHLSGLPLNGDLVALGGRWCATTPTAPHYRLVASPEGHRAVPAWCG